MKKGDNKKLRRPREERIIFGVLSGIGKYFDVDPIVVRLVFLLAFILTGFFPFFLFYVLAWLIIPEEPLKDGGD